jgi:hypothetical protein
MRATARSIIAMGMGACLLGACAQRDGASVLVARDSAGIRVVQLDRDRLAPIFAIDTVPAWVLGSTTGDDNGLAFHEIADAAVIADDVVAIAEASTQQIVVAHLASNGVRRIGRAGDGPEEFRGLAQVYDAGSGRIGAFDRVRNRYVEIDDAGRFVEVIQIPAVNQLGSNYLERAGTGALYLAAVTSFPVDSAPGARRGRGAVLRLDESIDTVTVIPGNTVFFEQDAMGGVLFGATTVVTPASSGLWVGDTEKQEVVLWGDDGIQTIVRWTSAGSRVLTDDRKAAFWKRLENGVPPEQRELVDEARERMFFADTIPAFGTLQTAPYGTLWIGDYVPPEPLLLQEAPPAQEWIVVDLAAGTAGKVVTPPGVRVLHVGRDFIMGVHMDELGIETLRRYDLRGDM